ncbi:HEAT domain-containing protein (plasmid) [Haloarcula sp. CBA1115]|uniref:HEAT repeat domain-containing protein n=1 Tax=unclassified Haloarcula TaxID=2624677 RepID=UPI0005955910|nr:MULTISPECIES: HEAT repeat domain-containing protein [unclassified Haloarcula]AJF27538.1 HEAT domain-containing protein [Haloarcula sp. CBA1115]
MDDQSGAPPVSEIVTLLEQGEKADALTALERLSMAGAADQQACLRSLKAAADDQPKLFDGVLTSLTVFLQNSERPTRLTTAKLFVTVSESAPDSVVPVVPTLAERLADESEFYYVRARCAEALGYVAVDHPDAVVSPEVVADLRIGLEFDKPEVREKLAKALAHVAMGRPDRLRYQVDSLAEHLRADSELVRYHLSTALVVIGSACPERLTDAREALVSCLEDQSRYVRGRAAEALGLLAGTKSVEAFPEAQLEEFTVDEEFVAERARFALSQYRGAEPADGFTGIAARDAIRTQTSDIVSEIRTPEGDDGCPHCGLSLPESGPPLCPGCGTPL